jgi:hypothetical protein
MLSCCSRIGAFASGKDAQPVVWRGLTTLVLADSNLVCRPQFGTAEKEEQTCLHVSGYE